MNTKLRMFAAVAAMGLVAGGCRVDPGETDYESQQISDFVEDETDAGGTMEFLPGPDPFGPGDSRLTFGPFYEGSQSAEIPIDDVRNFFFVFDANGQSSIQITTSDDRIEGFESNVFEHAGGGFWGMSLAWFTANPDDGGMPRPEDMSAWTTAHISFKSSDPAFADLEIGVASEAGEGRVSASDYGYTNDGEWHTLDIPLDDFGTDLTSVTTPLILVGEGGAAGDELLVDNFYYSSP